MHGSIDKHKVIILVGRQLDAEFQMLDRLDKICACFTANALESVSDNFSPPPIRVLEGLLSEFTVEATKTVACRASILELIGQFQNGYQDVSVRRFIQHCREPWRSQLEEKRIAILERINELKIQLAGDSAAVFYSYDFYRRIVNSLIGSAVQETEYCQDGKPVEKNTGKIYERAC